MDVLKLATDWARAEVFSTKFFILFGVIFIAGAIGFWQIGKSEIARAYIIPLAVCGTLLIIIGSGLLYTNITRISSFTEAYNANYADFLKSELSRIDSTIAEYNVVLKVVPSLIAAAALLMIFIPTPTWRAICISIIAMLTVIILVDGTAHYRMVNYGEAMNLANNNTTDKIEATK